MNLPAKSIATPSTFCSNPNCNEAFDLDKATAEIQKSGIVYADCGEVIFQGYKCPNPNCRTLWFVSCDRNNLVFDLRDFIMIPNFHDKANMIEQLWVHKNTDNGHESLKFNFIPAWDENVPIHNFSDYYNKDTYDGFCMIPEEYQFEAPEGVDPLLASIISENNSSTIGIPYLMTTDQFERRLNKEFESGIIRLRRLYPDIPKFRNLLTCLAPNRITEIEESDGVQLLKAENDGSSAKEFEGRNSAWRALLEESGGKGLNEAIVELLRNKGVANLDENEVETLVVRELTNYRRKGAQLLREQSKKTGFEESIWKSFEKAFKEILYAVCTELALAPHRNELIGWVNKAEKGKALFVDAPMGLGKTYSIVEALAENPELSAVIFMPTKKLCEELVFNLKGKIAGKNETDYWGIYQNLENVKDSNGDDIIDQDGFPRLQYRRDWLESEVYYADGINYDECDHFDDITERYSYNWIIKNDFCEDCKKQPVCRFILHDEKAPFSRIVITTHHQYDRFYRNENSGKWLKNGTDNDSDAADRDFFIVDEDLVLSKCYQPTVLNKDEFRNFTMTINNFLVDPEILDGQEPPAEAIDNIDRLFGKFSRCDKTSIIPPIDPEFKFPDFIKEAWNKSFFKLPEIVSDSIEKPETVGNHLEIIENAIRLGLVVQNYDPLQFNKGKRSKTQVYKAYFSNPTTYDLSDLPPHVFFDGTKIDDKFLERKLKNVDFERMEIKVDSIWQLRVQQNVNSDLPKKRIFKDKEKVLQLVAEIFKEMGPDHKYYIVSSKETREKYLEDYLKQHYSTYQYVITHYGNLRGINEAKSCDIGIMLGSFIPPDALEIAMALEFIQDKLPKVVLSAENNLWTWCKTNNVLTYKDEFAVVDEMARTKRQSEHRQAIARTRYLFHDVDFYVLSKDPVESYEPYLPQAETYQFKANIFPPRKKRFDTKCEEVKKAALNWLANHDTVNATEIYNNYGIRRQTAGTWLKVLCTEGTLEKVGRARYKLPSH